MEILKNDDFIKKVVSVSNQLGINPNDLLSVMHSESGLNPSAVNKFGGAVGLIQFMPSTLAAWGLKPSDIIGDWSKQLELVLRYYRPFKGKLKGYEDLYLATFYPYALTKPLSYVIGSEKSPAYVQLVGKQNPSINEGKPITKADFIAWVQKRKRKQEFIQIAKAVSMPLIVFLVVGFALKMIIP